MAIYEPSFFETVERAGQVLLSTVFQLIDMQAFKAICPASLPMLFCLTAIIAIGGTTIVVPFCALAFVCCIPLHGYSKGFRRKSLNPGSGDLK